MGCESLFRVPDTLTIILMESSKEAFLRSRLRVTDTWALTMLGARKRSKSTGKSRMDFFILPILP
jgi:hypothetical protein